MRRGLSFGLGILVIMVALGGLSGTMLAHADRDLSVAPRAVAGSIPITGEYWAVIIGIDRYQHAPKLETAVRDAVAVRDVLVERYGFKRDRIIELLNDQATGRRIQNALFQLGRQAGPEDSIFIYYAGHGQYEDDGRIGWWVPVEAEPRDPGTFIMDVSILNYVRGMKAKHVYLVADSCFSGTLFGTRAMPPIDDQWFARLYKKPSRWGLTSGATEPVADKGKDGHSIFAYHFIKLLRENEEPYLVPSRIHDRLAPLVANNANQTPRSEPLKNAGDEGGQFVFRLAAAGNLGGLAPAKPVPVPGTLSGAGGESAEDLARMKAEIEALRAEMKKPRPAQPRPTEEARARPYETPQQAGKEIVGKDGSPMLLIPAGSFWMGSTEDEIQQVVDECMRAGMKEGVCRESSKDELPRHQVTFDVFYLDKYEVTNKLFQEFVRETGYETTAEKEGKAYGVTPNGEWIEISGANWRKPEGGETVFVSNREEHPVVAVSWYDAENYCRWAGKRLPTEAEFEYALRAGTQTTYWWGNGNPGSRRVANIADMTNKERFPGRRRLSIMDGYDDGYARTSPVGSFEPNPWGLHDMIGNVAEWAADWYGKDYYERSPRHNPTGPPSGQERVLRGGSWLFDPQLVRSAIRLGIPPALRSGFKGFRCAKTP